MKISEQSCFSTFLLEVRRKKVPPPELKCVRLLCPDVGPVPELGGHGAKVGPPLRLVLVAGGLDDGAVGGVAVAVLLQLVQDLGSQLSVPRLNTENKNKGWLVLTGKSWTQNQMLRSRSRWSRNYFEVPEPEQNIFVR